jgi:hypothetical protein
MNEEMQAEVEYTVSLPKALKRDIEAFARTHYDGDTWKMLADAHAALRDDKVSRVDTLDAKIRQLEEKLEVIRQSMNQESDEVSPTLGGRN